MTSSISVLTWCFRAVYREDPSAAADRSTEGLLDRSGEGQRPGLPDPEGDDRLTRPIA
jgi:hypothetical protein